MQMPASPEVFANELSPPSVQGGSNFFLMLTERQRWEVVRGLIGRNNQGAQPGLYTCRESPGSFGILFDHLYTQHGVRWDDIISKDVDRDIPMKPNDNSIDKGSRNASN
jgi:ribulose kinase